MMAPVAAAVECCGIVGDNPGSTGGMNSVVDIPVYSAGVRYEVNTAATYGSISTLHYGEKFVVDKVETYYQAWGRRVGCELVKSNLTLRDAKISQMARASPRRTKSITLAQAAGHGPAKVDMADRPWPTLAD